LNSFNNKRTLQLSQFYKGYKNLDLLKDEYVEEIIFHIPNIKTKFNFEKVSKRTYLDIASVNSAIKIEIDEGLINSIFISAGGVSPIPLLLKRTSEFFTGKMLTTELVLKSLNIAQSEISPISDIRGSEEYKRLLLNQLLKAHFIKLFTDYIDIEALL